MCSDDTFQKKNASETVWLNKSNSLLLLLSTLMLFIYRIVEMITYVNKGAKNMGQLRSKLYVSYLWVPVNSTDKNYYRRIRDVGLSFRLHQKSIKILSIMIKSNY